MSKHEFWIWLLSFLKAPISIHRADFYTYWAVYQKGVRETEKRLWKEFYDGGWIRVDKKK